MLLVSPHMREGVHQRLDKHILYGDQVGQAAQWGGCLPAAWHGDISKGPHKPQGRLAAAQSIPWQARLQPLPAELPASQKRPT